MGSHPCIYINYRLDGGVPKGSGDAVRDWDGNCKNPEKPLTLEFTRIQTSSLEKHTLSLFQALLVSKEKGDRRAAIQLGDLEGRQVRSGGPCSPGSVNLGYSDSFGTTKLEGAVKGGILDE
ncbi:hypothetical protein HWI79_1166 [Cryptosporidium felis]|nr:hypothetical protein HWI79_1166 [Cryptosporidium felis]